MLRVGLTGGIASGKTTVAGMFSRLGAHVIDADVLAHQALATDSPTWRRVVQLFGQDVLDQDRTINRARVGRLVFANRTLRRRLEAIIHPEVRRRQQVLALAIAAKKPSAVVIFDIPLLIETGGHRRMDRVIVVTADRRTQIHRLLHRRGLDRDEAQRRLAAQMPFREKVRHADYVVSGTWPLEKVRHRVRQIYDELSRLARRRQVDAPHPRPIKSRR